MALTKVIGSGLGAIPAISGANLTGLTDGQMPAGSVLQVVQTVLVGTATYSHSNTSGDISGMSADITPSSSSNKVLVMAMLCYHTTSDGCGNVIQLKRGSTNLGGANEGTTFNGFMGIINNHGQANDTGQIYTTNGQFLDSPSTTSSTTYKLTHAGVAGTTPLVVNQNEANTMGGISTLTLLEIAG